MSEKQFFSRLANEEKEMEIEKKRRANITEFSEYNSTIKGLLSQIADCRVLTDAEFLLQVKSFDKDSQIPPPPPARPINVFRPVTGGRLQFSFPVFCLAENYKDI